ncbi:MAG: glutamyl-tRNA reductase [Eubacterium sp.]|nr:glutamyl-tRNA reductase [Eubacterium sp.]
MGIQMIGIDHSLASVKIREQFALTVSQAGRAMEEAKKQPGIKGCVILSTCNRMELYVSAEEDVCLPKLLECICRFPAAAREYAPFFQIRQGQEAAAHLMYLAAGLKSRILGEDQILSQVKDALKRARELYCTDPLLEVLFRCAVTAGKDVKAKGLFVHTDASAVHCALAKLREQGFSLEKKNCLVIGNGVMGKTAALALRDAGASVTVTVRQYRSGMVEIPAGCDRIHYGERYERIPECDLVLSATVSPNLTIRKEPLAQARGAHGRRQIFIDLAVPRDMEEEIAQLDGVDLYDIDSFQSDAVSEQASAQKQEAEEILAQKIAEWKDWCECRELIPRMQQVGRDAADELCWRMRRVTGTFPQEEQETLYAALNDSAQKIVDKILYTLRDGLAREELYHCVELLEQMRYSHGSPDSEPVARK